MRRSDVEHDTAPDRAAGSLSAREAASNEAVPRQQRDRRAVDVEPGEAPSTWLERIGGDRRHVPHIRTMISTWAAPNIIHNALIKPSVILMKIPATDDIFSKVVSCVEACIDALLLLKPALC